MRPDPATATIGSLIESEGRDDIHRESKGVTVQSVDSPGGRGSSRRQMLRMAGVAAAAIPAMRGFGAGSLLAPREHTAADRPTGGAPVEPLKIHSVVGGGGLRLHVREWGRADGPAIL